MTEHNKSQDQKPARPAAAGHDAKDAKVKWDDTQMASTYANVVNAASSREEVTILFGTNRTWNVGEANELIVNLTNRIILNPHAAKRLLTLLAAVLADYERQHGKINIGSHATGDGAVKQ